MGGKGGGGDINVPQVTAPTIDLSKAMDSFKNAASVLAPVLGQGAANMYSDYARLMNNVSSYNTNTLDATNELRAWMGLDRIDPTAAKVNNLVQAMQRSINSDYPQYDESISPKLRDINNIMQLTQNEKDPEQRAALQQKAFQAIRDIRDSVPSQVLESTTISQAPESRLMSFNEYQDLVKSAGPNAAGAQLENQYRDLLNRNDLSASERSYIADGLAAMKNGYGYTTGGGFVGGLPNPARPNGDQMRGFGLSDIGSENAAINGLRRFQGQGMPGSSSSTTQQVDANGKPLSNNLLGGLDELTHTIGSMMKSTAGYTTNEIQKKLEADPNYGTMMQTGMQALTRQQAAAGRLASGQSQLEAVRTGQDIAGQIYDKITNRLSGLAQMTMPMAQQATALGQAAIGANYTAQIAPAGIWASAYNNMGNAQVQGNITQAQLATQASMANAQNSVNAQIAQNQASAQASSGLGGIFGTVLGATLGGGSGGGLFGF